MVLFISHSFSDEGKYHRIKIKVLDLSENFNIIEHVFVWVDSNLDCIISCEDSPLILADIKTMNDRSFRTLKRDGTVKSHPQYADQLTIYAQALRECDTRLNSLLYTQLNKNNCEGYIDLFTLCAISTFLKSRSIPHTSSVRRVNHGRISRFSVNPNTATCPIQLHFNAHSWDRWTWPRDNVLPAEGVQVRRTTFSNDSTTHDSAVTASSLPQLVTLADSLLTAK